MDIFCFSIDNINLALPLDRVAHVFRSVSIRSIPESSPRILGLIDVRGELIPVVNFRYRMGLPPKDTGISERFILAFTERRKIILVADEIQGIDQSDRKKMVGWDLPGIGNQVAGIVKFEQGIYFIYDLDRFLTSEDEQILEKLMAQSNQKTQ